MSYGVLIKNANTNSPILSDSISFYTTNRGGISTSDPYFFTTANFKADTLSVYLSQHGSLLGTDFSFMNFDLNDYNFYGVGINISRPTVIELCKITSYEIGIGQTIYSDDFENNTKYIRNFSDPGNIYVKTDDFPVGLQTSYFGKTLNFAYPSSGVQHFVYVYFEDSLNPKYFLSVPDSVGQTIPNNFSWYEIPDNTFYYNLDYFITVSESSFAGLSLELSEFQGIIPKKGQTILVDCTSNDQYSGVYTVQSVTNDVKIVFGSLKFNFPGQTFYCKINLDTSNSLNYNDCVYYVPFEYGHAAECFTKDLNLVAYNCPVRGTHEQYPPLYKDLYDYAKLHLHLAQQTGITKNSDVFQVGIAVSDWFPDSKLFGVNLNYEIKEGFSTNVS